MKRLYIALALLLFPVIAHAAAYQLTLGSGVVRETDGAIIPNDSLNQDWQVYQAWIGAGNTPDPAVTPPNPTVISSIAFFDRFTSAESQAIWRAAASDPSGALGAALTQGLATGHVDLSSSLVKGWVAALVSTGAITNDRATAILTP